MQIDIIRLAEIVGAVTVVIGTIISGYKIYDKIMDRLDRVEERVRALETETDRIKKEDALVIYALRACLDGLHQQGCNGKVTEAIQMIDKYINKAAHDQD